MAIHRLTKESLSGIDLKGGIAAHKFITTPRRVFFGDGSEFHENLLQFWEMQNPQLITEEKEIFEAQSLRSCPHVDARRLAIVDAGLMVVEGVALPETVSFEERSEKYGIGDRMRTQLIASTALGGSWKLHLPNDSPHSD
jgi:hypothetical protein